MNDSGVHRDDNVEAMLSLRKELSIRDSRSTNERHGFNRMTGNVPA